jgi:hypothetical protein
MEYFNIGHRQLVLQDHLISVLPTTLEFVAVLLFVILHSFQGLLDVLH